MDLFLLQSKIDGLPQLWYVLQGDINFVWPKACVVNNYNDLDRELEKNKTGVSGEASIKHKSHKMLLL